MIFKFRRRTYSDAQIVLAYQTTDRTIQQFWYDKCKDQFGKGTANYSYLSDFDRDELFQESFIILWDKMEGNQIYTLRDEVHVISKKGDRILPDLMGYFMRIVKNKYFDMLNSGKFAVPIDERTTANKDEIFEELYWNPDPEVEMNRIVYKCLMSLPKSCQEILTKFYFENKSLEQILKERESNTSYDGLKSRKSKCMNSLRENVKESFTKAGLRWKKRI